MSAVVGIFRMYTCVCSCASVYLHIRCQRRGTCAANDGVMHVWHHTASVDRFGGKVAQCHVVAEMPSCYQDASSPWIVYIAAIT